MEPTYASPECAVFEPPFARSFCESNVEAGVPYCEFYVRAEDGSRTRCTDFCTQNGLECLRAWHEHNDSCARDDDLDCNGLAGDYVCRCGAR